MREAVTLPPSRRRRLSVIVKRHALKDRPFIVSVHRKGSDSLRPDDESVRLRCDWTKTLVGSHHTIVITYLPLGGGGSNGGPSTTKQVGTAVALLALMVASGPIGAAVAGAVGASAAIGQMTAAGIVIGGALLL